MRSVYPEHELKLLVVRTCVMLPLQDKVVVNLQASTAEPAASWSITSGPFACFNAWFCKMMLVPLGSVNSL
jgi:hypothetical protein